MKTIAVACGVRLAAGPLRHQPQLRSVAAIREFTDGSRPVES